MIELKYFTKNKKWFSIDDITKDFLKWTKYIRFIYRDTGDKERLGWLLLWIDWTQLIYQIVKGEDNCLLSGTDSSITDFREKIKMSLIEVWFKEKEIKVEEKNKKIVWEDITLEQDKYMEKKIVYILVWVPGSGKSTYLESLKLWEDSIVLWMDLIRKELYWEEIIQWDWYRVFCELQRKIKEALENPKILHIYVDNTSMYRKARKDFLDLKSDFIDIVAINFITSFHISLERNNKRAWKIVPQDVMYRMLNLYQAPTLDEWFSEIIDVKYTEDFSVNFIEWLKSYIFWNLDSLKVILDNHPLFSMMYWLEQTSQYHQEDLVTHLKMIWEEIIKWWHSEEDQRKLLLLNIFHDTGKITTRRTRQERFEHERGYVQVEWNKFLNKKWEEVILDNYLDYQFIWHENVSKNLFVREFEEELVKSWIIERKDIQLYRDIIDHHLLFHKSESLLKEPIVSLDWETKRLWKLFSKYDSLWRISLVNTNEY